jgi:hypothetical protein
LSRNAGIGVIAMGLDGDDGIVTLRRLEAVGVAATGQL